MTAFMKLMGKNFSPSIISSRKKKTKNKVRKEIETTKKMEKILLWLRAN